MFAHRGMRFCRLENPCNPGGWRNSLTKWEFAALSAASFGPEFFRQPQGRHAMKILALDLGKFKSVACCFDSERQTTAYGTLNK